MPSDSVRDYRECGYCHTWNTRPCGEQCAWSPDGPKFIDRQPLSSGSLLAVIDLNTVVAKLVKGEATNEDYAQARERLIAALKSSSECDRDTRTALLSATEEAAFKAGWEPIETAPKDGNSFLSGAWSARHGKWLVDVSHWDDGDPNDEIPPHIAGWCWHGGNGTPTPTHWMPLPDPPVRSSQAGSGNK